MHGYKSINYIVQFQKFWQDKCINSHVKNVYKSTKFYTDLVGAEWLLRVFNILKDILKFVPSNGDKLLSLTRIGNQQSFTVVTPVTITGLSLGYYPDSTCLATPVYTKNSTGVASMAAGIYSTSDQTNYGLCSNYPGGCTTLLSDAKAGTVKAMQYTYTFATGLWHF